jgi:soluble lytic murein transglycosylase-like protein
MSTTSAPLPADPLAERSPAVVQSIDAPSGTIATMIREASAKYGIDDNLTLEIARCESSLRQFDKSGNVVRGKVNSKDVGVFQINEDYHLSVSRKLGLDIYTTRGNIEYAMLLIKRSGRAPWGSSRACWADHVAVN